MVQCFSLTTKQHQPAYQPQKPFAGQPVAEGISDKWISEEGSLQLVALEASWGRRTQVWEKASSGLGIPSLIFAFGP
jgi:hypothetical protein